MRRIRLIFSLRLFGLSFGQVYGLHLSAFGVFWGGGLLLGQHRNGQPGGDKQHSQTRFHYVLSLMERRIRLKDIGGSRLATYVIDKLNARGGCSLPWDGSKILSG